MSPRELLKSYRGKRLKSQEDVAKVLNVTRQTYTVWENNPLEVETNLLFDILKAIDVDEEIRKFLKPMTREDFLRDVEIAEKQIQNI